MKRQLTLEEISDGRLYSRHDMVRAGCGGCRGCSRCCRGMGDSVILDPLDMHRLVAGTGISAEALLDGPVELHVEDGIILPNLRMAGKDEVCGFLDDDGRCSIHPYRPGICRLFPLGRYYEEGDQNTFHYFLQTHECPWPNKTKVRVEKWLEQPEPDRYERYILNWHQFLEKAENKALQETDDTALKNLNLYFLKWFYLKPYEKTPDFYEQFDGRLKEAAEVLDIDKPQEGLYN